MGNSLIERGACAGSEDAVKVDTTSLRKLALVSALMCVWIIGEGERPSKTNLVL